MPITITGVNEAITSLTSFLSDFNAAKATLLKEAANQIVQQAQSRAPVDTGFLRDNIQITTETDDEIEVTSQAEYSIYVEEGTSRMPSRPFMLPAAQEVENTFPQTVQGKIRTIISENFR